MIRLFAISFLTYLLVFPFKTITPTHPINHEAIFEEDTAEELTKLEYDPKFDNNCFDPQNLSEKIYSQLGVKVPELSKTKSVKIAVIDTGVDLTNPIFANAVPKPKKGYKEYDFIHHQDAQDYNGHGTHISGVLLGIYPHATLLPLKWGQGLNYDVKNEIKALKYAIKQKVDIINISIEGLDYSEEELEVLKLAEKKGILVVVAAGNSRRELNDKFKVYPASFHLSNMIVVGGHTHEMDKVPSSNYSWKNVDTVALGHPVWSLNLKENITHKCFTPMTGTSMAAPFVTGFAAILKHRYPKLKNHQIKEIILSTSRPAKSLERASKFGHLEPYRILDYKPRTIARENKKSQH